MLESPQLSQLHSPPYVSALSVCRALHIRLESTGIPAGLCQGVRLLCGYVARAVTSHLWTDGCPIYSCPKAQIFTEQCVKSTSVEGPAMHFPIKFFLIATSPWCLLKGENAIEYLLSFKAVPHTQNVKRAHIAVQLLQPPPLRHSTHYTNIHTAGSQKCDDSSYMLTYQSNMHFKQCSYTSAATKGNYGFQKNNKLIKQENRLKARTSLYLSGKKLGGIDFKVVCKLLQVTNLFLYFNDPEK